MQITPPMGQSIGEYGSEYANHFETNSKSQPQHLRECLF